METMLQRRETRPVSRPEITGKPSVALYAAADDPALLSPAGRLAGELDIPMVTRDRVREFDFLLVYRHTHLELCDNRRPGTRPVFVDFSPRSKRSRLIDLSRRQPLARALGARTHHVVDATAGLGNDTLLIYRLGYRVTAIERNVIVAALLEDGLRRADSCGLFPGGSSGRPRLLTGDAKTLLPVLRPAPEVVYLDPMFPPRRKKSALAKKELRILRELAGDNGDAGGLWEVAMRTARKRVVVKRPLPAPALSCAPDISYSGKLVRYDVYVLRK